MSWFRLVFLPFLIIEVVFLALYTLLYWYLVQKLHLDIRPLVTAVVFPALILILPLYLWYRPVIQLLVLKDYTSYWLILPFTVILFSEYMLQQYVNEKSYTITKLKDISEISTKPYSKYYSIDQYYAGKRFKGKNIVYDVIRSHSRYNHKITSYTCTVYYVCPIVTQKPDRYNVPFEAWIGKTYYDEVDASVSPYEREFEFSRFIKESDADYEQSNPGNFLYVERLDNTDYRRQFERATSGIANRDPSHRTIILTPVTAPITDNSHEALLTFLIWSGVANFLWFILLFASSFDRKKLNEYLSKDS